MEPAPAAHRPRQSQEFFRPARTLYAKYGFRECGPFGDYVLDPNSVFMTLELESGHDA